MSVEKIERENFVGKIVRYVGESKSEDKDLQRTYNLLKTVNNLMLVVEDDGDKVTCRFQCYRYYEDSQGNRTSDKGYTDKRGIVFPYHNFLNECEVMPDSIVFNELRNVTSDAEIIKSEVEVINRQIDRYGAIAGDSDEPLQLTESEDSEIVNKTTFDDGIGITEPKNAIELAKTIGYTVSDLRTAWNEKADAIKALGYLAENMMWLQTESTKMLLQLTSKLAKIEKVIKSINLYLGTNEQIIQIKHGAWADKSEKLVIRQLVLFCDEESLIRLDSGGLDFETVTEFDDWLVSNDAHIKQIAPENKCIVALKPRRKKKNYKTGDGWAESNLNKRNAESYILIRHGENLFRVAPEYQVSSKLFPTQKEMDDYFKDVETDEEFNNAYDKFTNANLHYRNSLVLLQGIIDRTGIFADLQEQGVNLLWQQSFQDKVILIHDADESKLLHTGRETFKQYQERLNSHLEIGHRVILGYTKDIPEERDDKRFHPNWNHGYPDENGLYILERGRSGYDYKISWERDESDYRSWQRKSDKPLKSTVAFYKNEKFFLAYDLVSSADMEYFRNDRLSRSEYVNLIPMIKRIELWKRKEERAEKPFLLMLTGYLQTQNPTIERGELLEEAKDLIRWWKFKNKKHRTIQSNDRLALRQIMSEYKGREKTKNVEIDIESLKTDKTLVLFRKNKRIVRLEKFDNLGAFVNQTEFYATPKGVMEDNKGKKIFTNNISDNLILYVHDDWSKWIKGKDYKVNLEYSYSQSIRNYWEQKDIDFLKSEIPNILKQIKNREYDCFRNSWDREEKYIKLASIPFAIQLNKTSKTFTILVYNQWIKRQSFTHVIETQISTVDCELKGESLITDRRYSNYLYRGLKLDKVIEPTEWFPFTGDDYYIPIVEGLGKTKLFDENKIKYNNQASAIEKYTDKKVDTLINLIRAEQTEEAKQKYLSEFGDERNWSYYKDKAGINWASHNEKQHLENFCNWLYADTELIPRSMIIDKPFSSFGKIYEAVSLKQLDRYWKKMVEDNSFPSRLLEYAKDFIIFPSGEKVEVVVKDDEYEY